MLAVLLCSSVVFGSGAGIEAMPHLFPLIQKEQNTAVPVIVVVNLIYLQGIGPAGLRY